MRLVLVESPYAGKTPEEIAANVAYARRALRDSLDRGESPVASHLLLTQVLDDTNPEERALGISAGLAWGHVAHAAAVYTDRGISPGMKLGIAIHEARGLPVEYRQIGVTGRWYNHVFVCGTYAGAYDFATEAEALYDKRDREARGLSDCGCRYEITRSSDNPRP